MKLFNNRSILLFIEGMEYKAKKTFNNFHKGETYTYIRNYEFGDRTIEGHELFFHDPEKDTLHSWRANDDIIEKHAHQYFSKVGGWDVEVKKSIVPVDLNQFDLTQRKKLLNLYIPYFKSIIEGEKEIRNWRYWIAEYNPLIEKILPRMDYLQWKLNPIKEIAKFLKESNIPFKKNKRYFWINQDISKYFNI
ncbi:hypothetical protein [Leptospira kirschneri]|uniref:hypothetical protein n=2 Tax=Leptospira kirschneri TaxID=29507 RepID=UPI00034D930E|nr:hypothetical protein [Leptospira kirschneri]KON76660.1 Uncharacterized protein NV38_0002688 [Leptospira kirschneri serovar Mozdok]KPZ76508.1 hypothetical protein APS47_14750 [Leptospira kirschneri serovar Mozdok]NDK07177.1 hypothetical protein [Leptospira kirschneri serovar Mozdok]